MIIYIGSVLGTKNLQNLKKKNYHLMYMDDIKLFAKNRKIIRESGVYNENIQSGYANGI